MAGIIYFGIKKGESNGRGRTTGGAGAENVVMELDDASCMIQWVPVHSDGRIQKLVDELHRLRQTPQ